MAGFSILAKLGLDSSKFKKGIKTSDTALSKFGTAIGNVVKAGAAVATTAFTAFTAKGIKDAADFDSKITQVFTLMPDITKEAMEKMSSDALDFSKTMGVDAVASAEALYQAISAGVPPDSVFEFMETAAKAAIGGATDLETAVDGITSVINAYGRESITAQEASDAMFTSVRLGKTTFEELSTSLSNVLPVANAAGVSFDEVAAALAVMTAKGVPTAVATTQLRQAILSLIAPTPEVIKQLDTLELSADRLRKMVASGPGGLTKAMQEVLKATEDNPPALKKLMGSTEALQAVLVLATGDAKDMGKALDGMNTKTGALDTAFFKMEKTVGRKLEKLKTSLKVAGIKWGEAFLPVIEQTLPQLEAGLMGLVPALTGTSTATDNLKKSQDAAATSLRGVIKFVLSAMNLFGAWADVVVDVGKIFVATFQLIRDVVKAGLDPVLSAINAFFQAQEALFTALKDPLNTKGWKDGGIAVKKAFGEMTDAFDRAGPNMSEAVEDGFRRIKFGLRDLGMDMEKRFHIFDDIWNDTGDFAIDAGKKAGAAVKELKKVAPVAAGEVKKAADDAKAAVVALKPAVDDIKKARDEEIKKVKELVGEGEKLLENERDRVKEAQNAVAAKAQEVADLRNDLKKAEEGIDEQRPFWKQDIRGKIIPDKKEMRKAFKEARAAGFKGTMADFIEMKKQDMRDAMKKRDDIVAAGRKAVQEGRKLQEKERKAEEKRKLREFELIEKRDALAKLEKETVDAQKEAAKEIAGAAKSIGDALDKIKGKKIPVTIDTSALDNLSTSIVAKDGGVASRLDGGGTRGAETHQHDITVNVEGVGGGGGEGDITLPPIPGGEDTELSLESTQIEVLDTLKGYFVNQ